MRMGMNGFPWAHGNPMGMGTIDEHFMGIRMGMGWRFMGIEVLGM
jgi:hypothetical protein